MRQAITAIVVDDEELSRENIRHGLEKHHNWQVVGEYEEANGLLKVLHELSPNVVFLDINMPGISGIEIAKEIFTLPHPPLTIFVTAFDEHATQAFELMAIDYLLKPFNDQRFDQAIKKIEYLLNDGFSVQHIRNWQYQQFKQTGKGHLDQLVIRSVGSIKFITVNHIVWIKASGNYIEIHHKDGVDLQRITIKVILDKLDPNEFIQVHRSAIIKIKTINEIKISDHNCLVVKLSNGAQVKVSAAYKNALLNRLDV